MCLNGALIQSELPLRFRGELARCSRPPFPSCFRRRFDIVSPALTTPVSGQSSDPPPRPERMESPPPAGRLERVARATAPAPRAPWRSASRTGGLRPLYRREMSLRPRLDLARGEG